MNGWKAQRLKISRLGLDYILDNCYGELIHQLIKPKSQ